MECTRLKKEREGKKKIQKIKMNNSVIGEEKGVRERVSERDQFCWM